MIAEIYKDNDHTVSHELEVWDGKLRRYKPQPDRTDGKTFLTATDGGTSPIAGTSERTLTKLEAGSNVYEYPFAASEVNTALDGKADGSLIYECVKFTGIGYIVWRPLTVRLARKV